MTEQTRPETAEQMTPAEGAVAITRGVLAVVALFATAADAFIAAVLGIPPAAWLLRRVRYAAGDEYRRAKWHAVDAEVIEADPGDVAGEE